MVQKSGYLPKDLSQYIVSFRSLQILALEEENGKETIT